jgi:lysophospholipase L1-like esterase
MSTRSPALILLAALATACGGGSSGPTDPGSPTPGSPVSGFVYYDENANGVPDAAETVRLPGVGVAVGGKSATTVEGGRFSLSVPNGSQTAQASASTLPAYFAPGTAVSVAVPPPGDVAVAAVLGLGARARPNAYLGFGDSITAGEGSGDGTGYSTYLRNDLRALWGKADVTLDGLSGSKSYTGEARIVPSLNANRPAYVLILYGTNDYNDVDCRNAPPCYTVDALRSMVVATRDFGAFPVIGTIPPVNPNYVDRNAAERNDWVKRMNDSVRAMARQERVAIAEIHGDFLKQPSLPALFADDKHPNDAGYQIMARSFYDAITKPLSP